MHAHTYRCYKCSILKIITSNAKFIYCDKCSTLMIKMINRKPDDKTSRIKEVRS